MDSVTTYRYAYGDIEAVREGDFNRLQSADSFQELKIEREVMGVVRVPKLVGVYQGAEIIPNDNSERKDIEKITKLRSAHHNLLANLVNNSKGLDGSLNKDLIHISYDPSVFPSKAFIREVAELTSRVRVSPYGSLPNFFEKNVATIPLLIQEGNRQMQDVGPNGSIKVIEHYSRKAYDILMEISQKYGLTLLEDEGLSRFEECMNARSEKKIIIQPSKESIESLLETLDEE